MINRDEIYHHGVSGMKWGKRNGPPYPLNAAGKASLAKQRKSSGRVSSEDTTEYGKHYNKYTNAGKAVVDTILSAIPGYRISNIAIKKAVAQGKQIVQDNARNKNQNVDAKTGLKLKNKELSTEKDLSRVNPGYQPFKKDTQNNCPMCCVAFDLRRRGFDVRAENSKSGMTIGDIEKLYKNGRFKETVTDNVYADKSNATALIRQSLDIGYYNKPKKEIANDIVHSITSNGDSRGIISNRWQNLDASAGHVVMYEVKGGKLTIMDGQTNTVYKNPNDYLTKTDMGSVKFMRTDNLEPNYKTIKEKGMVKS